MPNIFKLPALDLARRHRQTRMFAFQGLDAGHFISAHHGFALLCQFWSLFVQRIDIIHLLVEAFIGFPGQPVTDQVRLEAPFLSSREACRAEMVSTIPRFISSSAISHPVHWLIGRPAFSGFSQAGCSIWQIWSAVRRGGVPGRGRSSRRSATLKSASAIGCKSSQRRRHNRTVSREVFNSLAIPGVFFPSAANHTIRPRKAFRCSVVCRLTSFSNAWRSASVKMISGGFGPGMIVHLSLKDGSSYHIPGPISALVY